MDRCKCGSFAINEHAHGRIKGKHSDLCDVCYWREEAKQARREGWEQAKRGAADKVDNLFKYESGYYHYKEDVADAIAAMEYRETTND